MLKSRSGISMLLGPLIFHAPMANRSLWDTLFKTASHISSKVQFQRCALNSQFDFLCCLHVVTDSEVFT